MKSATLTHASGRRDVVLLRDLSIPDRFALYGEVQAARGYTDGDRRRMSEGEPVEPSGEADLPSLAALGYATVGLSWLDPLPGAPTLREARRDLVEAGHAYASALWSLGYHDASEIGEIGRTLLREAIAEAVGEADEVSARAEGFGGAPR